LVASPDGFGFGQHSGLGRGYFEQALGVVCASHDYGLALARTRFGSGSDTEFEIVGASRHACQSSRIRDRSHWDKRSTNVFQAAECRARHCARIASGHPIQLEAVGFSKTLSA